MVAHSAINHAGITGVGSPGANVFVGNLTPLFASSTPTALTANRAYLYKFTAAADVTVATAKYTCTASAGNLDIGIYSSTLTRLASTGSFASGGTGARSQALTAPLAMTAGTIYYLAFAASSTTLRVAQFTAASAIVTGGWNVYGREESALPLPAGPITADAWEDHTVHPAFWFMT